MNTDHLLKVAEQDRDFAFKCKVIAYSLGLALDLRAFAGREREAAEDLFQTFTPFHDPNYLPDPAEVVADAISDFLGELGFQVVGRS